MWMVLPEDIADADAVQSGAPVASTTDAAEVEAEGATMRDAASATAGAETHARLLGELFAQLPPNTLLALIGTNGAPDMAKGDKAPMVDAADAEEDEEAAGGDAAEARKAGRRGKEGRNARIPPGWVAFAVRGAAKQAEGATA